MWDSSGNNPRSPWLVSWSRCSLGKFSPAQLFLTASAGHTSNSALIHWQVPLPDGATTAIFDVAGGGDTVFVCAHGAGGNHSDRGVVRTCETLRSHGIGSVRFNFPYRERKSGRPDPMPKLTECIESVVAHVRATVKPRRLVIGGRSMGGRAASMLAAKGFDCDGLLLLAYPLHPPGRTKQLRDAHLPDIHVPTLCINGTRDDFCERPLMDQVLARVGPGFAMHWVDGADHSFHVLKSSGRTDAQVMDEIGMQVRDWLARSVAAA